MITILEEWAAVSAAHSSETTILTQSRVTDPALPADNGITLEACPTSNVCTGAVPSLGLAD